MERPLHSWKKPISMPGMRTTKTLAGTSSLRPFVVAGGIAVPVLGEVVDQQPELLSFELELPAELVGRVGVARAARGQRAAASAASASAAERGQGRELRHLRGLRRPGQLRQGGHGR